MTNTKTYRTESYTDEYETSDERVITVPVYCPLAGSSVNDVAAELGLRVVEFGKVKDAIASGAVVGRVVDADGREFQLVK